MTGTEFATLPIRFVLYYDDNSFLGEKGKVLYRNVKGYEFRKFLPKRGAVTIKLYNGEDIVVSYKVYQFIEQQIQLAKERKITPQIMLQEIVLDLTDIITRLIIGSVGKQVHAKMRFSIMV